MITIQYTTIENLTIQFLIKKFKRTELKKKLYEVWTNETLFNNVYNNKNLELTKLAIV